MSNSTSEWCKWRRIIEYFKKVEARLFPQNVKCWLNTTPFPRDVEHKTDQNTPFSPNTASWVGNLSPFNTPLFWTHHGWHFSIQILPACRFNITFHFPGGIIFCPSDYISPKRATLRDEIYLLNTNQIISLISEMQLHSDTLLSAMSNGHGCLQHGFPKNLFIKYKLNY